MGAYRFIANRIIEGQKGPGRIRVLVKAGSDTAEGDYRCPTCGTDGKISQPFKRPVQVRCESCGFLIRLARLKDEKKKEKKAAQ